MRSMMMHPAMLVAIAAGLAGLLSSQTLLARIGTGTVWHALLDPQGMGEVVVHFSWLPRLLTSWFCGAALGLSGVLMQQVLRNPLASPTTLGVSAGAHLALVAASLAAPGLLAAPWLAGFGREAVALAGSAGAALLVFSLAWNKGLAPLAVVLAGMVVSLYFGALGAGLVLYNQNYLAGLFIWGAGSLSQQDWTVVLRLGPCSPSLLWRRPPWRGRWPCWIWKRQAREASAFLWWGCGLPPCPWLSCSLPWWSAPWA